MIGRLLCVLGVHRYRITRWRPYWDGARRCVEGIERCRRPGCVSERFFERGWVPR